MAHTMDEGQVIAYWEATASEYDATDNPHVIFEALLSIAVATPEMYRGATEAAAKAVGRRFCPHGNEIPGPLPEIKDVKDKRAAARAHAGLCGLHHAHHIAHIDLDAADARAGCEATTFKNLRNQACYETGVALNARGRGVQLARKKCFTQACRAIWPGDAPLPEPVVNALHASPP